MKNFSANSNLALMLNEFAAKGAGVALFRYHSIEFETPQPEGLELVSPGQRPGTGRPRKYLRALKGRDMTADLAGVPGHVISGLKITFNAEDPGRCPGLTSGCAFGAVNELNVHYFSSSR